MLHHARRKSLSRSAAATTFNKILPGALLPLLLVALAPVVTRAQAELKWYHPAWGKPEKELRTVAVVPLQTNRRMAAQRSAFTLSGDSFEPLNKEFDGVLESEGFIRKIVLPANTYDDAEQYLELAGVGHFGYFPDFEGLLREHKEYISKGLRERFTKLKL